MASQHVAVLATAGRTPHPSTKASQRITNMARTNVAF